jgi:hypothetical protein
MEATVGLCSGKIRSTPTPADIFRTVNISLIPPPRLAMQRPSKAWSRSLSPSRTRTITLMVSPGLNAGMSVRKPSWATAASLSIFKTPEVLCTAYGVWRMAV